jgi:hypothetical protein
MVGLRINHEGGDMGLRYILCICPAEDCPLILGRIHGVEIVAV